MAINDSFARKRNNKKWDKNYTEIFGKKDNDFEIEEEKEPNYPIKIKIKSTINQKEVIAGFMNDKKQISITNKLSSEDYKNALYHAIKTIETLRNTINSIKDNISKKTKK